MKNQKRTLISCAMLEDEVNHILEKTHLTLPVIWIDRGLHNRPENLNQLLQEHINQLQNQDEILLTFGLCGIGTAGLVSPIPMQLGMMSTGFVLSRLWMKLSLLPKRRLRQASIVE